MSVKWKLWITNTFIPNIGTLIFMVIPTILYIVVSIFGIDPFGGSLSGKAGATIVGLIFTITLYFYVIYKKVMQNKKYEEALEEINKINLKDGYITALSLSKKATENKDMATYIMELATSEILSFSVYSTPPLNKSGRITEKDDSVAASVFKNMKDGKKISDDFKFYRIISQQDNNEEIFFEYLNKRKEESLRFRKGIFDFKVYPINGENNIIVQMPNFIVVDSKYLFITLRQSDEKSRGVFIANKDLAESFALYFNYIWSKIDQSNANNLTTAST